MRHPSTLLLALSLLLPTLALAEVPTPGQMPAEAMQTKKPGLKVSIDRSKVDLVKHSLEVTLSRAAEKVHVKVIGESGTELADVEKPFNGAPAGTVLSVSWTPSSDEAVARIEVWGHDTDGFYAGVAIIPWNVNIPHEDVKFETDSDVIRSSEVPKLTASLQKVKEALSKAKELGNVTLYIVGHTDTVGPAEHNLALSRRRARSIAGWFKANGLKNPIAYEGLGETSPAVKTADEVDEPRNRRVDYILSAEPPRMQSGEISWKVP